MLDCHNCVIFFTPCGMRTMEALVLPLSTPSKSLPCAPEPLSNSLNLHRRNSNCRRRLDMDASLAQRWGYHFGTQKSGHYLRPSASCCLLCSFSEHQGFCSCRDLRFWCRSRVWCCWCRQVIVWPRHWAEDDIVWSVPPVGAMHLSISAHGSRSPIWSWFSGLMIFFLKPCF